MKKIRVSGLCISLILLSGCSSTTFKTFNVAEGESLSIDASQRTILVKGDKVCAEPSPDAMRALAAQFAAEAVLPNGPNAKVSSSLSETAATIGVRTATIQLVRDILYRVCEATMNGLIDDEEVVTNIINGMDNLTVALQAIEGLTGFQTAPTVVIGADTKAAVKTEDGVSGETKMVVEIKEVNSNQLDAASIQHISQAVTDIVSLVVQNEKDSTNTSEKTIRENAKAQ